MCLSPGSGAVRLNRPYRVCARSYRGGSDEGHWGLFKQVEAGAPQRSPSWHILPALFKRKKKNKSNKSPQGHRYIVLSRTAGAQRKQAVLSDTVRAGLDYQSHKEREHKGSLYPGSPSLFPGPQQLPLPPSAAQPGRKRPGRALPGAGRSLLKGEAGQGRRTR